MMGYREALEAAGAKVTAYESFGSWQGDWLARVTYEGRDGIIAGSYGSCSYCDAFDAEFGLSYDEWCEDHDGEPAVASCEGCVRAARAAVTKNMRLVRFGRSYLDSIMTPDELARYVARITEEAEWDTDAPAILTWLRENAV
jgi:hypothetical protein